MWSRPYHECGYDVRIVTLPDDVRLYAPHDNVYGILAAPPCTEFSSVKHFHGKGNYSHNFLEGIEVVSACMRIILIAKPKFWALENPASGYLKKWLGEPAMIFDPWEYGDNYQKTTALWGEFSQPPKTVATKPEGLIRFSLLKSKDIHPEYYGTYTRQERRAITPQGFARAFFEANR